MAIQHSMRGQEGKRREQKATADGNGGPSLVKGCIHEEGREKEIYTGEWPLGSRVGQSQEMVKSWGKKKSQDWRHGE